MYLTSFQWYLVIINVVAFVLYTTDYFIYQKSGDEFHPQGLLNFSTTFGGALGTLIAFLVWDKKVNKTNITSRIYTIEWLTIQALLVFAIYGPNKDRTAAWFSNFYANHQALCIYIIAINAITLIAFIIDKIKAINGLWRIREIVLLGLSILGGSVGALLAMDLCNHKVKSNHFMTGVPIMIVIHLLILLSIVVGIV